MSLSSATAQPPVDVAAVAGGVLGGVACNIILVYLVWRFCLKGRETPLYEDLRYETIPEFEPGNLEDRVVGDGRERGSEMQRFRDISSKRWSKRTMETRWSSIRTESTGLESAGFDRFSLKGLPPVPIILEREGEGRS